MFRCKVRDFMYSLVFHKKGLVCIPLNSLNPGRLFCNPYEWEASVLLAVFALLSAACFWQSTLDIKRK